MNLNKVIKDNKELLIITNNDKEELKGLFNQYINGLTPEEDGSIKVDCDEFFKFVCSYGDIWN